jgi:hypothetical protein
MCWFGGRATRDRRTRSRALVGWKIVSCSRGPLYFHGRGFFYLAGGSHTMGASSWYSPRSKFRVHRNDNAGFHVFKSKASAMQRLEARNSSRAPSRHDKLIKVKVWGDMLAYPGSKDKSTLTGLPMKPAGYRAEHMEVLT